MTSFTLAEVLIVLGIIGLIADMTIPTLHQSITEKVTATKLKKAYSTLDGAVQLAIIDNGTVNEWGLVYDNTNGEGAVKFLNILSKYLKLTKNCENREGCFYPDSYLALSGKTHDSFTGSARNFGKAILSDGTSVAAWIQDGSCTFLSACGVMYVDTNGLNKPNQTGKDSFWFSITKSGVIPNGTALDTSNSFNGACKDKSNATGRGCTAWVIYNENMDYLHCNDLSWDNKKSCK